MTNLERCIEAVRLKAGCSKEKATRICMNVEHIRSISVGSCDVYEEPVYELGNPNPVGFVKKAQTTWARARFCPWCGTQLLPDRISCSQCGGPCLREV